MAFLHFIVGEVGQRRRKVKRKQSVTKIFASPYSNAASLEFGRR